MRKSLRRAFALACAVPVAAATLVVGATPASAAAPACPIGSEVTEFDILIGGHFRVAAAEVTPTEYTVCIQSLTTEKLVVVLKTGVSVTPPSITTSTGTGSCATQLINMTSPVDFQLSFGYNTNGPKVCIGRDFQTQTLSFNTASVNAVPDVDVWLPSGSTALTYGYCGVQYATYVANPSNTNYYNWYYCYYQDRRIL